MKELETYFRENYNSLVKIARRRVGGYSLSLAEDAVQEAFCRALRYQRTYKGDDLDVWFRSILHNAVNQIKGQERDRGVTYRDDMESDLLVNQERIELPASVGEALSRSSERDQEILNMRFFFGFKTREIHELLNISHDVVRDVIRRFKERLRA